MPRVVIYPFHIAHEVTDALLLDRITQFSEECRIVRQHDNLSVLGFLDEAAGNILTPVMVKRRNRVVEHDPALVTSQTQFGEKRADSNSTLFAFA